jgi:hypothetical protein
MLWISTAANSSWHPSQWRWTEIEAKPYNIFHKTRSLKLGSVGTSTSRANDPAWLRNERGVKSKENARKTPYRRRKMLKVMVSYQWGKLYLWKHHLRAGEGVAAKVSSCSTTSLRAENKSSFRVDSSGSDAARKWDGLRNVRGKLPGTGIVGWTDSVVVVVGHHNIFHSCTSNRSNRILQTNNASKTANLRMAIVWNLLLGGDKHSD